MAEETRPQEGDRSSDEQDARGKGSNGHGSGLSGAEVARLGLAHIENLTGRRADTLSGIRKTEGGWSVSVEIVELERIPPSTDVLASYEVEVDSGGELVGFNRGRRYYRNQASEE